MRLAPQELLNAELPLGARLLLPAALLVAPLTAALVFTQGIARQFAFAPALGPPLLGPLPEWLVLAEILLLLVGATYLHYRLTPYLPFVPLAPLGAALHFLNQGPLYAPMDGFQWALILVRGGPGRAALFEAALPALATGLLLPAVALAVRRALHHRYHPSRIAHGSARYAEYRDLAAAGMLRPGGIFLGHFPRRGRLYPITDDSQHHTLFVMPSGAGKSAGHIIPSLLTPAATPSGARSALVLDPKGELYAATAGWRSAQGHRSIRLAPLEDAARAERWNPLLEVDRGADDIGTLGLLAEALIVSPAATDSHWDESARALFRCLALHVLYTGDPPTLHHIRALLHHSLGMEAVFANILDTRHDPDHRHGWRDPEDGAPTATHPEAALLARGFLDVPEKEMGSIASTLRRALALWGDPRIVASTSVSDFDLGLFNQDEPITLYVVIPYADLHRLAPWVRLLLAALMRRITHFREAEKAPPLDLYLDEFASLGRVQSIHQILSFLRGYGVRAHIVIQSYDDLERLYGRGENISACQIHVVAATQSRASRRFISDLGGEATVQWERHGRSGGPLQPLASRHNRTPTEARRPLITQGEVGTLGPDEILIAKTGMPMIRARKHFYFRDRVLRERAAVPVPLKKSTPIPSFEKGGAPQPTPEIRSKTMPSPLPQRGDRGGIFSHGTRPTAPQEHSDHER